MAFQRRSFDVAVQRNYPGPSSNQKIGSPFLAENEAGKRGDFGEEIVDSDARLI